MKKNNLFLLMFGLLSLLKANAQDSTAFDLKQAEEFALNNNQSVKNAELDIEISQKKIWETTAIGLPQVSASGDFQQMLQIPTTVIDASLFDPTAPEGSVMEFQMGQEFSLGGNIQANQLLFDGSYIVGLQFAKFYKQMAETNLEKTEIETKIMVRQAYYNVLVAEKNLALLDSILLTTQELWDQTKVMFETGFILEQELNQLELTFNRINANRQNATNQVKVAKNLLKLQMGYDIDQDIELTLNFDDILSSILTENPALQEFNINNNYNYILVNQQMELDQYSLKNEKAAFLPSLGAFYQYGQNSYNSELDFSTWYPTSIWGVSLSVPISSSGQKIVKVQQAQIKLEQDQNNINQLEQSLKFQELQLKANFTNAYQIMLIEDQNVALAQSVYSDALARKKEGVINALTVSQLQSQLLQAEANYISATMQLFNTKIELDKLFNQ